ncbi:MAG TPA: DUF1634 domain-containing protein [Terriglobales bacterium]|jgi:uncharacterized membrane protein
MADHGRQWSDQRIENTIGNLLRFGVMLAAAVVVLGAAIFLSNSWREPYSYQAFRGEPSELRTIGGILSEAAGLQGRGIMQLGLLLLIATPVSRVAFSIWGFAEERDRLYVGFAMVVLVVLLYSLLGSSYTL